METKNTPILPVAETLKTIFDRRAVRKYRPDMPDDDMLETIIDAGRMAPSAMNAQPWKFYIVTHKDTIESFSKEISKLISKVAAKHPLKMLKTLLCFSRGPVSLDSEDLIFHDAPVVIFITSPKDNKWSGLDCGMCAQNMMLAARSLGLDSCPVGFARCIDETPIYQKLGVPPSEEVQLAVILGYGAEKPEPGIRIKNNAIFIDRMECC